VRPFITLTGCLALAAATGCAAVVHKPLTDDSTDRGIRYYRSSPYLIAYSNGKGGVVTEIKYLPDPAKLMSVRPEATLADVGTTLEFDHGMLTTAKDTGDATALTKAVLEAAGKIGMALIAGNVAEGGADPTKPTIPAPYIYRIVVTSTGVTLVGGDRQQTFQITLLEQPAVKEKQ
jgi:hypothetical protein